MKKALLFMSAVVFATSLNTKAFADENLSLKNNAGVIIPGSIFYNIDVKIDNIRIGLTSDDVKKAEIISDVAEERLGESEITAEKGNDKLTTDTLEQYNEKMSQAADIVKEIVNKDEDTNKIEDISSVIEQKQEKSIEVLKNIQNKVGDSAKEVIGRVIEMQTVKKQAVANMVKKRHELNTAKKNYNMAKAALNKAVSSGDQQAAIKAQETLKANENALNKAREELKTAFQRKQAAVKQNNELKKQINEELTKEVEQGNITNVEKKEVTRIVDNNSKNAAKKQEIKKKIEERKIKIEQKKNKIKEKVEIKKVKNNNGNEN